jgi:hypothetical protein
MRRTGLAAYDDSYAVKIEMRQCRQKTGRLSALAIRLESHQNGFNDKRGMAIEV